MRRSSSMFFLGPGSGAIRLESTPDTSGETPCSGAFWASSATPVWAARRFGVAGSPNAATGASGTARAVPVPRKSGVAVSDNAKDYRCGDTNTATFCRLTEPSPRATRQKTSAGPYPRNETADTKKVTEWNHT